MTHTRINRALLSVSDKTGIVEFAKQLSEMDIEIISTGGTAKLLRENKISVTDISDYTGFPEIMDGRVKTLHPKVHGALLGRIGQDSDLIAEHGITPIDLVVVNLYPFIKTVADPNCDLDHAVEQIDIGGPTMLRAAAKNHQRVTVVSDSSDYARIIQELRENKGQTSLQTRFEMACKAFTCTAEFDTHIAQFLNKSAQFPDTLSFHLKKKMDLRYGENPHQKAAFYEDSQASESSITTSELLQGKPLSYNNIADADAALECVRNFTQQACVIVKHANPCGVALNDNQLEAYQNAFACDPTSSFGGIIAFNHSLSAKTAQAIINNQFVEVIIAPEVELKARDILLQKPNVRVLITGDLKKLSPALDLKQVNGGLLVQERDIESLIEKNLTVVTEKKPSNEQLEDLKFAWIIAKHVKSNAIVYAKDNRTIGIGAGQMSRIDSAKIAASKTSDAKLNVQGAVMASDAFFPFRDAIDRAAQAGITAIIQPGGSIRDKEVIQAANEHNIVMVFTGMRHFKH